MNNEIIYTHRTRSGAKARIICENAKGECPIVALVLIDDFEFIVKLYSDFRLPTCVDIMILPNHIMIYLNTILGKM